MPQDGELISAAGDGKLEEVRTLIRAGADINEKDRVGFTPLHVAAILDHPEVVRFLLEAGADKNAKDRIGHTPQHAAACNNCLEVMRFLLEAGADKNAKDRDGDTPLHIAALYGRPEVVRALVEAGADITAKNKAGKTPLDVATRRGHGQALATLLREAGSSRAAAGQPLSEPRHSLGVDFAALEVQQGRRLPEASALRVDFATSLTVEERPIAAGSFKSVFRAEWCRADGSAAVTVALLKVRGLGHAELEREVEVFVTLGKHPHLAKLLGVTTHPDGEACMLVEYAPCGSLDKVLSDAVDQETEPSEVVRIVVALQICEAMTQLVEHGVVHRDLATRNVLVFRFSPWDRKEVVVKVTDYGQALLGAGGSRGVTTHSGETARPVRWLSPEALRRRVYSQASDVWAFGVALWELESGAAIPYWEEESDAAVAQSVVAGRNLLGRPNGCSDAVWGVMHKCWAMSAKERPAFSSLKMLLQDALGEATARAAREPCVVCQDAEPVMVLSPCGHKCVCAECLALLTAAAPVEGTPACPLCRVPVEGSVRVFGN